MDDLNDTGVIVREVLPGHDVLALGALDEKIPETFSRKSPDEELLQQPLKLQELFRIFAPKNCAKTRGKLRDIMHRKGLRVIRTSIGSSQPRVGIIPQNLDLSEAGPLD